MGAILREPVSIGWPVHECLACGDSCLSSGLIVSHGSGSERSHRRSQRYPLYYLNTLDPARSGGVVRLCKAAEGGKKWEGLRSSGEAGSPADALSLLIVHAPGDTPLSWKLGPGLGRGSVTTCKHPLP